MFVNWAVMSEKDCDGEEGADLIPAGAWRGARRSGVLLADADTPLLESVKAATAPRRSSIIKVGLEQHLTRGNWSPKRKSVASIRKPLESVTQFLLNQPECATKPTTERMTEQNSLHLYATDIPTACDIIAEFSDELQLGPELWNMSFLRWSIILLISFLCIKEKKNGSIPCR